MDCLSCCLSGLRSRSGWRRSDGALGAPWVGQAEAGEGAQGLRALWRGWVTVRLGSGCGHVGPLGFQGGRPWSLVLGGGRSQPSACEVGGEARARGEGRGLRVLLSLSSNSRREWSLKSGFGIVPGDSNEMGTCLTPMCLELSAPHSWEFR